MSVNQGEGLPGTGAGTDILPLGLAGRILLRHWLLLVLGLALGLGSGMAVARAVSPTYSATATQLVKGIPGSGVAANYEAAQFAVSRARSYPSFIYSQDVLAGVARDLGEDDLVELRRTLSATAPSDTPLVQITATGRTAEEARDKANSAARHMASFIVEIETVAGKSPISVETAVQAHLPQEPSEPRPILYAAIGGSAGLVLAIMIAIASHFSRAEAKAVRPVRWRWRKRTASASASDSSAGVSQTPEPPQQQLGAPVDATANSSVGATAAMTRSSRSKPISRRGARRKAQLSSRQVRRRP